MALTSEMVTATEMLSQGPANLLANYHQLRLLLLSRLVARIHDDAEPGKGSVNLKQVTFQKMTIGDGKRLDQVMDFPDILKMMNGFQRVVDLPTLINTGEAYKLEEATWNLNYPAMGREVVDFGYFPREMLAWVQAGKPSSFLDIPISRDELNDSVKSRESDGVIRLSSQSLLLTTTNGISVPVGGELDTEWNFNTFLITAIERGLHVRPLLTSPDQMSQTKESLISELVALCKVDQHQALQRIAKVANVHRERHKLWFPGMQLLFLGDWNGPSRTALNFSAHPPGERFALWISKQLVDMGSARELRGIGNTLGAFVRWALQQAYENRNNVKEVQLRPVSKAKRKRAQKVTLGNDRSMVSVPRTFALGRVVRPVNREVSEPQDKRGPLGYKRRGPEGHWRLYEERVRANGTTRWAYHRWVVALDKDDGVVPGKLKTIER